MDLHEACYQGRIDVVSALLAAGADPNQPAPPGGRTWFAENGRPRPLTCVAIAWGLSADHVAIARMLVAHGAIVDDAVLREHAVESTGSGRDQELDAILRAARA